MSQAQQYIDLYNQTSATLKKHAAPLLNARRDEAFEQFCQVGFPTRKAEEYLYCPLFPALDLDFGFNINQLPFQIKPEELFKCDVPGIRAHNVFVVNEQVYKTQQTLPEGVIFCSLKEACETHRDIVAHYLNQKIAKSKDGFTLFNQAFAQDGYFLFVKNNTLVESPLQLINILHANNALMTHSHNLIVLEEGAQINMLVCDHATTNVNLFANRLTEIFVGENAHFGYYALESTHDKTDSLGQIFVEQAENSHLVTNLIGLHNGRSRNNIEIDLNGEHAETWLGGMFICGENQKMDNNTVIRHNVPNCTSRELFKYILDGESEGAFSGRILVAKDAQHTEAYQTNRNICLTKEARMHAKPQLEIYADDVKCGHGATTGQLDENALFYMRARGIGEKEARMMLLSAFTADILEQITVDAVRDRLRIMIEKRLRGEDIRCASCMKNR